MATKRNIKKAKIQRYYRTVIIAFAIVAFVLFALIAYFSFSNTIINVSINEENYSTSSLILISRELPIEQSVNNLVAGVLLEKSIEHTKEFTELTAESEVPDKAKGKVIIYNKYSQPQPLIATTRLLSESGILFRTDTRVDVPVGGQVEVSITADQPGEIGEIGPSRFTIPGLWTGLQDKIYAESTEPMTGGTIITTAATQENIDQAKDATFQEAYNIVMDELEKELKTINTDYKINAYKKSLLSEEASVAPDTQADSFSVTTSLNVVSLSFNEDEVQSLAMEHIKDNLPENMKFTLDTDKPFTYTIDNYNIETQTASLRITVNGVKQVSLSHPIFDRTKITNKDRNDILRYFSQYSEVESVDVHFSPFWVFRTPSLEDHIEIRLK